MEHPTGPWQLDPAVAHLNHGGFGAVPLPVLDEQRRWQDVAERNPSGWFSRELPRQMAIAREVLAAFVGTDAGRCVLLSNVTSAIAVVLRSVALAVGDEVLVTGDAYPGVRAAAEAACARAGATLVTAAMPPDDVGGRAIEQAVLDRVTPRTRLAIVEHVTSPTAILVDVASVTAALRERGIAVLVDGAHAPGSIALDVDAVGADFYAGNFHKWCSAPRGSAFLSVGATNRLPLVASVIGSRSAEPFPRGLEWWGTGDYSSMLATPAAIAFFDGVGWEAVRCHNCGLVARGADLVATALEVAPPPHPALPMAALPLAEVVDIAAAVQLRDELAEHGAEVAVAVSRGQGFLRISAQLYNRVEDYLTLVSALGQVSTRGGG